MSKITIIGAGSVGSTIAYSLATQEIAAEIVMIDINESKAQGEVMDINQCTPYFSSSEIKAGSYADAEGSDIVVVTSGVPRKPGQTRIDLAQTNVNIMKKIIPQITKYAPNAKYIIVSNPVDIITYQFVKTSGLKENQIIGTGTVLDTARLRAKLADCYQLNQSNIHAYVFGEHGDTSFVPWSLATAASVNLDDYAGTIIRDDNAVLSCDKEETIEYIRKSGSRIIERKGATFYGIANSVCYICKILASSSDTAMTVSSMMHGEYGIEDVCVSMIRLVNNKGITGKIVSPLDDDEIEAMRKSAESLKNVINQLNFVD